MMAAKAARRYFVRGRVQGVGYRYFVQKAAEQLGVTGYTRNLDDGRVEVYAIGNAAQLSEFAGLLWRGPSLSDVRGLDEQDASLEHIRGFHIQH